MNTDTPPNYKQLLATLASINIFFVILMTAASFLVFLSYDSVLWHNLPKFDIFRVFFQNFRFNLSVTGYFNLPVFALFLVLLAFRPSHVPKMYIGIIKSYYLSAFVAVFSLLTLSYIIKNMPAINAMMSADYFSKLAFIYSVFDNPTFITMLVIMSVLFLLTVFFFVLFIKMVIKSREYTVDDPQNAAVLTLTALFLCVFLAKGKIIGHLGMSDAAVTPVVQLNEYAAAGPYKILHDAKQLNLSQIRVMKDRKEFLKNGLVTVNDEEKARQLMYRFTPKQEQ